jgi:competence protein ComGC
MRYLFWKLWRNDQAFTLIELLVVFCLFVVFIVMTSGMIFHLSRTADIHANVIEKMKLFYQPSIN